LTTACGQPLIRASVMRILHLTVLAFAVASCGAPPPSTQPAPIAKPPSSVCYAGQGEGTSTAPPAGPTAGPQVIKYDVVARLWSDRAAGTLTLTVSSGNTSTSGPPDIDWLLTVRGDTFDLKIATFGVTNELAEEGRGTLHGAPWQWDAWSWRGADTTRDVRFAGNRLEIDEKEGTTWSRDRLVEIDCSTYDDKRSETVGSH
jgi:hypothetical protein